jgi:hypothetical protein
MQVTHLRADRIPQGSRISARYAWEDCARPSEEVVFEIEDPASEWADPAPEAFALIGSLAALHHGEKRVRVEGTLCPRFRDGVRTALRTVASWYPGRFPGPEPELEASGGFVATMPAPSRAGLFLSGGADSLFTLQRNRANFAREHSASYRDAIFVVGFGTRDGNAASERHADVRRRQRRSVEAIARLAEMDLLVTRCNVEALGEENDFFLAASNGAHLAAVALLFPRRLTSVSIAASCDVLDPVPWGSHPLLDGNYSTSAIEVRHEGFDLTREERIAALASWKDSLPHLMVCAQGPLEEGQKNCGRCEKCLRTMVALMLAGSLAPPAPFPLEIDPHLIEEIRVRAGAITFWRNFSEMLRGQGRNDLAASVEHLCAYLRGLDDWFGDRGWKGRLRRVDRRLFGGWFLKVRRHHGAHP